VGLQAVAAPDTLHGAFRNACGLAHGGRCPVRDL
jgi:hypothetical protein